MTETISTPFDAHRDVVRSEWIDRNGHMNMGYYVVVFDFATDAWLDYIGLDTEHRRSRKIAMRFATRLLDFNTKRIHYFHEMYQAREGYLAATNELMSLHVSQETRRSAPMAPEILERLAEIRRAHGALPTPPQVGRVMGLKAGRSS
jgi:acyl-CoA thioester hydrolase